MCRWFQYADDVGVISICHCCHGNQPRPICFRCHGNAPFRNNFFPFEHLQEVWDSCGILAAFCGFFWDSFGILAGFFWDSWGYRHFREFWDSFGILAAFWDFLGFFWDSFGILLGFFWDTFGIVEIIDISENFGILSGFLRLFGIFLGFFWDSFGIFGIIFWILLGFLSLSTFQRFCWATQGFFWDSWGILAVFWGGFFLDSWDCRHARDSARLPEDSFWILFGFLKLSTWKRFCRATWGFFCDSFVILLGFLRLSTCKRFWRATRGFFLGFPAVDLLLSSFRRKVERQTKWRPSIKNVSAPFHLHFFLLQLLLLSQHPIESNFK